MKLFTFGLFALALCSGDLFADDPIVADDCSGQCAKSDSCCAVTEGLAKLPQIEFAVGDEKLCCEESAKATASASKLQVMYVVGDEKFDSSDKALVALVKHTEKFVNDFATPSTCNVSKLTSIAGTQQSCSVKAGEIAAKVKKAMDRVAIAYKVGDETCECPVTAKSLAESKQLKTRFVVDGEETECEITARLNLARAKYKAALVALNKADSDDSAVR